MVTVMLHLILEALTTLHMQRVLTSTHSPIKAGAPMQRIALRLTCTVLVLVLVLQQVVSAIQLSLILILTA